MEGFTALGSNLWRALKEGNIEGAVKLYNTALAGIPYQDFTRQNESLYRSLFLMLLRGAGVTAQGEVPTERRPGPFPEPRGGAGVQAGEERR